MSVNNFLNSKSTTLPLPVILGCSNRHHQRTASGVLTPIGFYLHFQERERDCLYVTYFILLPDQKKKKRKKETEKIKLKTRKRDEKVREGG